uniref:At2g35280-like TPR domain-containing protein n=1 Tax=Brassica campestris TaxID=3711 RepID=M4F729_BRACM
MEFFPLLELPVEIQAIVVERAARNSIQDLYGLKASSRSMKALAERRGVYHFLDVLSVPWGLNMPSELLKACYDEGNPSTLYIKGVQFFYSLDLHEEGLSLMKRAADAGYERAVYTHAMTRAI